MPGGFSPELVAYETYGEGQKLLLVFWWVTLHKSLELWFYCIYQKQALNKVRNLFFQTGYIQAQGTTERHNTAAAATATATATAGDSNPVTNQHVIIKRNLISFVTFSLFTYYKE